MTTDETGNAGPDAVSEAARQPESGVDDPLVRALRAEAAGYGVEAPKSSPELEALLADIEGELERERGPVAWLRSRPTPMRQLIVGLAAAVICALVYLTWRRIDAPDYPRLRLAIELSTYALLSYALLATALRRGPHPPTRLVAWLALGAGLLLPFVAGVLPMAHALHPASVAGAGSDLASRALKCFVWGLAVCTPVAVLSGLMGRVPGGNQPRDALAAVSAGVVGVFALQLHCPITQPVHLVVGHATVVAGILVATLAVRRVLARR